MSESGDQWCKLVEQQLFRLESKQTALRGVVAYLAKRCGMNAGDFWQLITLADKAVYQRKLERVEKLSPECAVRLDAREDEEEVVTPEDFGLDAEFLKRLDELFGKDGTGS